MLHEYIVNIGGHVLSGTQQQKELLNIGCKSAALIEMVRCQSVHFAGSASKLQKSDLVAFRLSSVFQYFVCLFDAISQVSAIGF